MTHIQISVEDAVQRIIGSPAPVLFPDTCILVDLIRIPLRAENADMARRVLQVANHLITQMQETPKKLWVVICPPVQNEWVEHSQNTVDEMERHWKDLDKKIAIAHASVDQISLPFTSANTYSDKNIENTLKFLAQNFLTSAIFLDEDKDLINRAYSRVVRVETPSRKGSSEIKDCVIIEHSIDLCTQLRQAGFTQNCVFATSNTTDFCTPNSPTIPKAPLDSQLGAINLSLTTNWEWTKHKLGV